MFRCVSWSRWFKIAGIIIQMMIWVSVRTSTKQDVGTKPIGSFRRTPSFLSNWKATNKSKKICVKIPFMVKTLRCDWKDHVNPPVPAFREELPIIQGESLPEKGVRNLCKKDAFADLRYVKEQHLSWIVYRRVILSVKRTNTEIANQRVSV